MFKVGQKVVCIDGFHTNREGIKKGEIYIVRECKTGPFTAKHNGEEHKTASCIKLVSYEEWYSCGGFRPLDWADEALERAREAADKEPELYTLKEVACHEQ